MAMQNQTQDTTAAQTPKPTLNLNSIMIGTAQQKVMAEFYAKVLGRPADMTEGGMVGWLAGNCFINVSEHSEIHGQAKEPARIILNFETTAVQAEFERLKQLNVTVIKEPYAMGEGFWIATLADPDGNLIQLMSPWNM